jgi:hypothetical protein
VGVRARGRGGEVVVGCWLLVVGGTTPRPGGFSVAGHTVERPFRRRIQKPVT